MGFPGGWTFGSRSVEDAHFEEGSIPVPSDHDVIEQRDRHEGCCGSQRNRHLKILTAGRRIAAGMIVDDDEGAGGVSDDGDQEVPRQQRATVHTTSSYLEGAGQAAAPVQAQHPDLFVVEARQPGMRPTGDGSGAQGQARASFRLAASSPPPELERGSETCRLDGPQPGPRREPRWRKLAQMFEASAPFEQDASQLAGGKAVAALAEDQGQELGLAQLLDSRPQGSFAELPLGGIG